MRRWISSERVTLCISGEQALWTRWRGKQQIETFSERLPMEETLPATVQQGAGSSRAMRQPIGLPATVASECPWISLTETTGRSLKVHLIVDSPQSEVLRIETRAGDTRLDGSRLATGFQVRRLIKRLQVNHPDAVVRKGLTTSPLDALWLHREVWPQAWMDWLEHLQSRGVVISHVSTSADRLTEHALRRTGDDVLFVLIGARLQQHALVRDGVLVFRRVVSADGDDTIRTALTDTVNHLRRHLNAQALAFLPVGMSRALIEEWTSHDVVSTCLPDVDNTREVPDQIPAEPSSGDERITQWLSSDVARRPRFGTRLPATGPVREVLKRRMARYRRARLELATAASVLIASATVVYAAVQGVSGVERETRLQAERTRMLQQISTVNDAVSELHPTPALAEQFLLQLESFEPRRSTSGMMVWLANALQAFPGIGLDRLQWRLAPAGTMHVAAATSMQAGPFERLDAPGPLDASMPDADADGDGWSWVIEFSGKVGDARPLRQRQEQFEAFVEMLSRLEEVASVEVLLSPLARAAADSNRVASSAEPDYQLRVNLHDR